MEPPQRDEDPNLPPPTRGAKVERSFMRDNKKLKPRPHEPIMQKRSNRSKALMTARVTKELNKNVHSGTESSGKTLYSKTDANSGFHVDYDSSGALNAAVKFPEKYEQSKFMETRYASQLTRARKKVVSNVVGTRNHVRQMKQMKWAVRVFFHQIEEEEFNNLPVEEDWAYDQDTKSYNNNSGEEKDAAELQVEVISALNEAFSRELSGEQTVADGDGNNHHIDEVYFKREGWKKTRINSTFNRGFLCVTEQTVNLDVRLKDVKQYEPIHLALKVSPRLGHIRRSINVCVDVTTEGDRQAKLYFRYGFDCVSKDDDFADKIEIWKELETSQAEEMQLISQLPDSYQYLSHASKKMAQYLSGADPKKEKLRLGAIAVDLLKGVSVDDMNFKKNFDAGLERLRYITLEEGNRENIRKTMNIFSEHGTIEDRSKKVVALVGDPFDLSTQCEEDDSIDFFISHTWKDDPVKKFDKLLELSQAFAEKNNRYPKLWFDMFCIDQKEQAASIAEWVKLLPFFLMACDKMVVLVSPNFVTRLWCLTEVLMKYLLGDRNKTFLDNVEVLPVDDFLQLYINVSEAQCSQADDKRTLDETLKKIPGLKMESIQTILAGTFDEIKKQREEEP